MHALDVIFDLRFLLENRVFDGFNIRNLLPLAEVKKESLDDQQQRHEAEDAQEQGSKNSAERRERSKNRRGDSRKDARRESVHRRH
ncbi:hypothetical protein B0O99DRAFT_610230 [Bisporella sp. PMI_857]|nr:hypothetical protein B0O99DRAFT_610230 [Bisporella sp. PMI_857]